MTQETLMDDAPPYLTWRLRAFQWLARNLLPLGWLALLTGMFWVWDRSLYHKLYYATLVLPCILALTFKPSAFKQLIRNPLILAFLLFSAYTLLTLNWSDTDARTSSLSKRPLYVLLLLFSAGLMALYAHQRLLITTELSAIVATASALLSLAYYFYSADQERFSGYGALYNPLLSAHVYGFFAAVWLTLWFMQRNPWAPVTLASLGILGALIFLTGSRTPIVALCATILWLAVACWNQRSLIVLACSGFLTGLAVLAPPPSLTERGMSLRPEIWSETWRQILEKPWLGHGYDSAMTIWVEGVSYAFADPHNIELAILYYGGAIGLLLWVVLYATAIMIAWNRRRQPLALIGSSLLIFGLTAGLTEGGAFMSRPKEHWFLIWIPMALLVAAWHIPKQGQPNDASAKRA
jgi:O-antigen ligase